MDYGIMYTGTQVGNDFTTDPSMCMTRCAGIPQCYYWDWPQTGHGVTNECRYFDRDGEIENTEGFIAGQIHCYFKDFKRRTGNEHFYYDPGKFQN